MKISGITSSANKLLKTARGLKDRAQREKTGLFLVEGPRAVEEAFLKGLTVRHVIVSRSGFASGAAAALPELRPESPGLDELHVVDDSLFKELVTTESSCAVVAVAEIRRGELAEVFDLEGPVVILDGIQDPGNLGTIIRSAHAFEAGGLILTRGCVDPFNPKVVRSACGALFDLPLVWDVTAERVAEEVAHRGICLIVCQAAAACSCFEVDLAGKTALVFGSEGHGVGECLTRAANTSISVPMNPRSESLNVGVSAGIILFESYRQRIRKKT